MYSQCGEGAQVMSRLEDEGNEVGLFIKDPIYKTVFDGIVPKVEPSFVDSKTIIIFDTSDNGDIADDFKHSGHYVYGGSGFASKLEQDRKFGFDCMKKCKIQTPRSKEFTDFKRAKDYIKSVSNRLVFKPSGTMPCKLTYVSKNGPELLCYLDFVEKHFGKDIESFVLQDFVEGIVVSSEFFCNGKEFLSPCNQTVEVKKSMNDDLGPSTGCSGNITWICERNKIIDDGVAKIEELCVENNYIGQIDLNAVVNEFGVYGLEWTPRFGYDATPTLLCSLDMDFGGFFSNITKAEGEISFYEGYSGSIRLTIPPYPAEFKSKVDPERFSPSIGVPILDYEDFADDIYFYEVMAEDERLVHSGGSGVIACVIGYGVNPEDSLKKPKKILDIINVPDKQYRTDLDEVLPNMVKEVIDICQKH